MSEEHIPRTTQQQNGKGRPPDLKWEKFVAICVTLQGCGQKYKSCEAHGFSYNAVLGRMQESEKRGDTSWRERWDAAQEAYRDDLEAEAHRRAFHGVEKPVFYKGEEVGYIKEYSDRLMEVLLRGERPAKFRDNVKLDAEVRGGVLVVPAEMSVAEYLEHLRQKEQQG